MAAERDEGGPAKRARVVEPAAVADGTSSKRTLPRAKLGRTGLVVSRPCLGGIGLGTPYGQTTEQEATATVRRAVERGVNFIDTCPGYGDSERNLGAALRALTPQQREGLVICSKVGDECPPFSDNGGHDAISREGVRCSVEHSLRIIGIDRLDVVLLHDPTLEEVRRFLAPGGGIEALKELRTEGKVGYFGIGCVEHEQQLAFMESEASDCSVILTVNDFNLVRRYGIDGDVAPDGGRGPAPFGQAQARDIGIMNAGAYYMGLLANPQRGWCGQRAQIWPQYPKLTDLATRIQAWCGQLPEELGVAAVPLRALALQFALRHEAVATVPLGMRSAEQVDEVCDAALLDIPEKVWEAFDARFGEEVAKLDWAIDHWRFDKTANK